MRAIETEPPNPDTAAVVRQLIEGRLPYIAYQPVVDLQSREVIGHEALARCDETGFENPSVLFGEAIRHNMVGELGRLMRTKAVQGCPDAPLFLNIVPQELGLGWLLDPADPIFNHRHQIFIELTESVPVHYFELCHDILARARAQGIRVAVDDFGAGFSNLQYIADLEPDIVKLDRELIAGLHPGTRRFDLVQNVINLCVDMGAEVVAEGIETVEELEACIEAGAHYGQGFLLARPAATVPTPTWPQLQPKERLNSGPIPVHKPRKINSVENERLRPFLDRHRRLGDTTHEVDLNAVLTQILERANAFVPSAAGTIFLDDPRSKETGRSRELVFVACFGERADELLGTRLPADKGIVGHVYTTGRPYVSADPQHDQFFYRDIDRKTNYKTEAVICVPLRLEGAIIGAIQLLNRVGGKHYTHKDLELLRIFATVISSSMINAVDAQRAVELAKLDHLSGLYNDRHLHFRLRTVVDEAMSVDADCALLFMDLDNFKQINDTRGHLAGSAVLREIGFILREMLPDSTIPARYGGDEFVMIFPGTTAKAAIAVGEQLRERIEHHEFLSEADPYDPESFPALNISGELTCSIGVAGLREHAIPQLGESDALKLKNGLLGLADRAMYDAKEKGKNRVASAAEKA